jgi:hypothetical protein
MGGVLSRYANENDGTCLRYIDILDIKHFRKL